MTEVAKSLAVIVPSYNAGKYLGDLVASIFGGKTSLGEMPGQSLQPEEIVICNDCSTDNTEEIVRNLNKLDSRIRYCKTPVNSGTSAACNTAIRNTDCKFITRIDADDMRESFSYESMYPILVNNLHSMVYDDITLFSNNERRRTWTMQNYDFDNLLIQNFVHAGIMYTRKAWEEAKGYRESFRNGRDDWAFNVALGSVKYYGIHISRSGYLYRRDQQNRSITNGTSEWQAKFCEAMEKEFHSAYKERNKMGCCGNRNKITSSPAPSGSQVQTVVGAAGMTVLAYQGDNTGKVSYFGPVTGAVYRFSAIPGKDKKNVDNRDLSTDRQTGLLDLSEFGKPLFLRA
jgi:glycosyltransferase involved in cell wall biosynthesis